MNIDYCYDGDGGIFAFWYLQYELNPLPYYVDSLFIQHISKDGERLWGENGIFIGDTIINAIDSWIVNNDSGGIFIQYYKQTNEYNIEKYDSTGRLNWTLIIPINFSRAIKDGLGGIIISGVVDHYPANKLVINRISSEGEKFWGVDGIIVDDSVDNGLRYPAEIFINSDSTVCVFWDTQWYPNDEIFLQRYTLEGEQLWEEHPKLNSFVSPTRKEGIIKSTENSNMIFWRERRDSAAVYAQKIDEYGNKLWEEDVLFLIMSSGTGYDEFKVITDGNDGAIVVWRIDPPWGGIYAQQISKNGNLGEVITSVKEDKNNINPGNFYLSQNYPNPFNPTTKISFTIPSSVMLNSFQHLNGETPNQVRGDKTRVTLKVYDLLGREVATLVHVEKPAGSYEVVFNADGLTSGIYFYRIEAGTQSTAKKMILLK